MSQEFTLSMPNRGALWARLALTKTQLAELCGLTARQVSHWTDRGYIPPSPHDPDRYGGDAVDLCVLIKQALQRGIPLRRAVALARAYVADDLAREPTPAAIATPTLATVRGKLRDAEAAIAAVLEAVEPFAAQHGEATSGA
jgi:DNA-binding transcriptional MerR regulator